MVGLGYFGSFHANHYARIAGAELCGLVDADAARAAAAAATHRTAAFTDHRSLIGRVDAVSVAVPTSLHHAVAGELIDAGIHVLIEKPIAGECAAGADLVERARRAGVILRVGHIERFNATFAALRRAAGRPLAIDCVRAGPWTGRAADVDVVLDLMIHDIDLALSLAGAPVVGVAAAGMPVVSGKLDMAEARLTFANGVVARLAASRVAPKVERRLTVTEADRVLVADLAARQLLIGTRRDGGFAFDTSEVPAADALGAEIAAFLAAVNGAGAAEGADGQAGLDALRVAEEICAAAAPRHRSN